MRRPSISVLMLLLAVALAPLGAALAQQGDRPRVRLETTLGPLVIELNPERAPLSSANFLGYVRDGFYDGLVFHRVIADFVAQGGGYDRNYQPRPTRAPVPNESGNGLSNRRGSVALARTGDPHSADSQFYINLADNAALDPVPSRWGYAVFGQVIEGFDTLEKLAYVPTGKAGPFESDVPLEPVVILRATIVAPDAAPPAQPTPPAAPPAE